MNNIHAIEMENIFDLMVYAKKAALKESSMQK